MQNRKHSAVSVKSILGVQVFEFMYAHQFRSVCEATSIFQTQHYLLAPSTQFNYLLDSRISEQQGQGLSIEFSQQDWARFHDFQDRETQCKAKMMFRQLVFLFS